MKLIQIVGDTAVFPKMFLEQVSRKYKVRILNPKIGVCVKGVQKRNDCSLKKSKKLKIFTKTFQNVSNFCLTIC